MAGGVICALMGLIAFFMPAVRHMEDKRQERLHVQGDTLPSGAVVGVVGE